MVEIEKNVQKRMLRAILKNGGQSSSSEISENTGLRKVSVWRAGVHLVNRSLVFKKSPKHKLGYRLDSIYTLNEKYMWKINKMIDELEQYEKENPE